MIKLSLDEFSRLRTDGTLRLLPANIALKRQHERLIYYTIRKYNDCNDVTHYGDKPDSLREK